jgi:thiol-disulfide isomerase/thioredoxin
MQILRFMLVLCFTTLAHAAGPLHWETDLETAQTKAHESGKIMLIDFTGSTWCPPCIALHQEVISSAEFAQWAADKVLVTLDYPVRSQRTPEKVAANPELQKLMAIKERFEIPGFPTLILVSPEGKELSRTVGYDNGMGTAAYLHALTTGTP